MHNYFDGTPESRHDLSDDPTPDENKIRTFARFREECYSSRLVDEVSLIPVGKPLQ